MATRDAGFTLLEMLLVLGLSALLLTWAMTSFQPWRQRQQLLGLSAQLVNDVQWWRTTSVARHEVLRLTLQETDAGACYWIHRGDASPCQCSANRHDEPDVQCPSPDTEVLRAVWWPASAHWRLSGNVHTLQLDPRHGTISPTGTLELRGDDGRYGLKHIVNILGRVRLCSSAQALPGVQPC